MSQHLAGRTKRAITKDWDFSGANVAGYGPAELDVRGGEVMCLTAATAVS